ncbi:hypothetical protein GQ53DRAFT_817957 [Thozetella sp. PMI_491]|nr:hypothetical protein GQ53DRAFT_817957 [Thozetella sp. PMI_491]
MFGVENAGECYCDSTLGEGSTSTYYGTYSSCTTPCPAALDDACGAAGYINIYSATTAFTEHGTSAFQPASVSGFSYLGCLQDGPNRILNAYSTTLTSNNAQSCQSLCSTSGYTQYFGLEFGQQCFCGNTLSTPPSTVRELSCSDTCPGAQSNPCGGSYFVNVYQAIPGVASTTSSVVASSTSSPASQSSPPSSSEGISNTLSSGSIAGAAVGSVVGAALIVFLVWWLRRRSARGHPGAQSFGFTQVPPKAPVEIPASPVAHQSMPVELYSGTDQYKHPQSMGGNW